MFRRSPYIPPEAEKFWTLRLTFTHFWHLSVPLEEIADWWDWDAAEAAGELEPEPDIAQGVRMGGHGAERTAAPAAPETSKASRKRPMPRPDAGSSSGS